MYLVLRRLLFILQLDYLVGNFTERIIVNINDDEFKRWIKSHEGFSRKLYKDSVGKTTIGYGRNVEDNGISQQEADFMLNNDIERACNELKEYRWFLQAPDGVRCSLVNMCFNMGISRLLGFKNMIKALVEKNYTQAAIEALDSQWAKQVVQRAKDVAVMIREGK